MLGILRAADLQRPSQVHADHGLFSAAGSDCGVFAGVESVAPTPVCGASAVRLFSSAVSAGATPAYIVGIVAKAGFVRATLWLSTQVSMATPGRGGGFCGRFNGWRPARESLDGNGDGAPPVSRFLYRPHYRRTKSECQAGLETRRALSQFGG